MPLPNGGSILPLRDLSNGRPAASFPPLGPNLKVLLTWPKFPPSFWGFEGALEMMPEAAMTPPLGLITVAALCPTTWTLKLLDHAFDEITDEDLRSADLVMVSAMHAQRIDALAIVRRARALGTRTFIGGPWASSQPNVVLPEADHVMVGEAEEVFSGIAVALENGTAQGIYVVNDKPDMTGSPIPRFDLLRRGKYVSMPVQFSRGCPFQCDFCDIITIYGRTPRTKSSARLIAELDRLRELGWRGEVLVVDDNFIGNRKNALQLVKELATWGDAHGRPSPISLKPRSIGGSSRTDGGNGCREFHFRIPSHRVAFCRGSQRIEEGAKLLRKDSLEQVRIIQEEGLWVLAGSASSVSIPTIGRSWGRATRVHRTGRDRVGHGGHAPGAADHSAVRSNEERKDEFIEDNETISNFSAPNFRTTMPLPTLLHGLASYWREAVRAERLFPVPLRSLEVWKTRPPQAVQDTPLSQDLRLMASSMWTQGVAVDYRRAYWGFLGTIIAGIGTTR